MSITYNPESRVFSLETANSLYQMQVRDGVLLHLYYGKPTHGDMGYLVRYADRGFSGNPYSHQHDRGFSLDTLPQEYSGSGAGDFRAPSMRLTAGNGSRTVDLRYGGHAIRPGKRRPEALPWVRPCEDTETLEITLRDDATGVSLVLCYAVYPELDVITRSACVVNGGSEAIALQKAASACVDFPYDAYDVMHFHGRHAMERVPERLPLHRGTAAFGSRRGMSSHHENPFVILCERGAGEDRGDCWGFMLVYSGNHLEEIEVDQAGSVRVVTGIHPEGFDWKLVPGERFQTPEVLMAYSGAGFNGLSAKYHRAIRQCVMPERSRGMVRSVLVNSWEACYFDFDAEKLVNLAREARNLGMDMLVLDDGWFGTRNDDTTSLGDWTVNEAKLGCALGTLSERVHALGMKFGLWVEPEMISERSDLYRAHPNWALADPDRKPMIARSQLVLDMSRQVVVDYLFDTLCAVLDSAKIEYIKWDFNRSIANLYSHALPAERQGELAHRFMLGTYGLLERLTERYPDLVIEGCAGGGGRFDAGMLYYCPQIWCSDNTDPIERLEIQRGTSYGYPVNAMGAHVSASPNHQTGRSTPIAVRGAVAQCGTFGYELDPGKLSEEDRHQVRTQIKDHHRYSRLVAEGTYYRLGELDPASDWEAWMFVSPEKDEALVTLVARHVRANGPFPFLRLRGLDPDALYRLEGEDVACTGAALMYGGWAFEQPVGDYPAIQLHWVRV